MKITKNDWICLFLCLLIGIVAEECFFHGQIGVSYLVFIILFYMVFFWRYRSYVFTHQRFGYLLLICIWLLSGSYFLNDNLLFYVLNIFAIPALMFFHIGLVTSPKHMKWSRPTFLFYLVSRVGDLFKYNIGFTVSLAKRAKGVDESKYLLWKKIMVGLLISHPVLIVVLMLLTSADSHFEQLVGGIPNWFQVLGPETIVRWGAILVYTFIFFGMLQTFFQKRISASTVQKTNSGLSIDAVVALTLLLLLNIVYLLFIIVQFKYFFSSTLEANYTYAEYARKGFFELLFVTILNLSVTVCVLTLTNPVNRIMKLLIQSMLAFLVLASSIILCSAFLRLSMYEEAYGYTFTRVLVHSFMILLAVIFLYTFIRIWMEKLSLFHFYFIAALVYYTSVSIIDFNQIVVNENMARFDETGKIDLDYFVRLSSGGIIGLIDLYDKDPYIPGLAQILRNEREQSIKQTTSWQSYNVKREEANKKLNNLKLD